jgi:DNA-binding XRE family transcriptional regulator
MIKYPKRVIFPEGDQKNFLGKVGNKLDFTTAEMADFIGVHRRTLTDWERERLSMSLPALQKLCREADMPLPRKIEIRKAFWAAKLSASRGGVAAYRKYGHVGGDPGYRKKKWFEWWEREGRYRKDLITARTQPLQKPNISTELAEFIGILLGDGGITSSQVTVSLNRIDDRDFVSYLRILIQNLFKLNPSVKEREKEGVVNVVISRTELVKFLVKIGLQVGNKVKHQVDVPVWIKESEKFTKFCLRGLFDTDGCFYVDRHHWRDKLYCNAGMDFTNRSLPLVNFFKTNLIKFGFHPTQTGEFRIRLRRESEIVSYFRKIGSSNPKHIKKFRGYFQERYGEIPV